MRFKLKSRAEWKRSFAWLPVQVDYELVWLEWYWERGHWRYVPDEPELSEWITEYALQRERPDR